MKLNQYWTRIHWVGSGTLAGLLEPCRIKKLFRLQSSDLLKLNHECTLLTSAICSLFCCIETTVMKNKTTRDLILPNTIRHGEKYFPIFRLKIIQQLNNCSPLATWMLNSWKIVHMGGRVESGRVRLFVGNRGSGRVNDSPGRVGPKKKWPVDNSVTTWKSSRSL